MSATISTTLSLRQLARPSSFRRLTSQIASSSRLASTSSPTRTPRSSQSPSSSTPTPTRVYTQRKTFLYNSYAHLFDTSHLILLFQPNNLTSQEDGILRRAIASVPVPISEDNPTPGAATLTIARTGVLTALARERALHSPSTDLTPLLSGPIALLTCPSLSPKYLQSLLSALDKALSYRPTKATATGAQPISPRLMLLGGVMEQTRLVSVQEVLEIAKLPELGTLRAQLVGLLEMPGRQVVGVLGQAAGGSLVRTLQGLEEGLKVPEGAVEEKVAA